MGDIVDISKDTLLPAVVFRFARLGLLSVDIIMYGGQQVLVLRLLHHDRTLRLIHNTHLI
jgi:hypothetical protein